MSDYQRTTPGASRSRPDIRWSSRRCTGNTDIQERRSTAHLCCCSGFSTNLPQRSIGLDRLNSRVSTRWRFVTSTRSCVPVATRGARVTRPLLGVSIGHFHKVKRIMRRAHGTYNSCFSTPTCIAGYRSVVFLGDRYASACTVSPNLAGCSS